MKRQYSIFGLFLILVTFASQSFAVDPVQKGSMQLSLEVADPSGTDTVTDTAILTYIKASEIEPFIKSRLSRYGTVQVNDALNMILITDMEKKVADLIRTVKKLDSPRLKDFLRLETEVIFVKNTQAASLVHLIREKLSSEAVIKTDDNLNALIITDVKSKIDQAKSLIAQLDKPLRQVMMEVKIVELQNGSDSKLGVDWRGILQSAQAAVGSMEVINRIGSKNDFTNKKGSAYTADSKNSTDALQTGVFHADSFKGNLTVQGLDSILGILITDGKGRVLSSPRIVGANNRTAYISDGDRIFYGSDSRYYSDSTSNRISKSETTGSSYSSGASTIEELGGSQSINRNLFDFSVNAGLSLSVTPHIVTDELITLDINANINNLTGWSPTGGPIISSRSANSTVTVKNGEVFVMGGLKKESVIKVVDRWPILGYIPVIDFFFASTKEEKVSNDVVLFIAPVILQELGKSGETADTAVLEEAAKFLKEELPESTPGMKPLQ